MIYVLITNLTLNFYYTNHKNIELLNKKHYFMNQENVVYLTVFFLQRQQQHLQ